MGEIIDFAAYRAARELENLIDSALLDDSTFNFDNPQKPLVIKAKFEYDTWYFQCEAATNKT